MGTGLKNYSVLKGKIVETREERDDDTPHFQIKVEADVQLYRIAVNIMSAAQPPDLKYIVVGDFKHLLTDQLINLPDGRHPVDCEPKTVALDYIRGNLFNIEDMKVLPHDLLGPDNDLNDLLSMYTKRSIRESNARVYAFGEVWGPERSQSDRYFGFKPGQGIHDIHMNQGNRGRWSKDNGVYQDGGLILHYPQYDQWVGVFLAFQSQSIHTNEEGDPVDTPTPIENQVKSVRIVAAMVNPPGADPGFETVTLLNISDKPVNLAGWSLSDRNHRSEIVDNLQLGPGECSRIVLTGVGAQLSNKGGQITLMTPDGFKAHGVAYTKNQASLSGWTVTF